MLIEPDAESLQTLRRKEIHIAFHIALVGMPIDLG